MTKIEYIECPKFYTQEQLDKAIRLAYDEGFADGYTEGNQNCQHR